MKKNTEQTKILLQKALLETPEDFALSDVKFHIRSALNKLETVEKKRNKRQISLDERKEKSAARKVSYNTFSALQAIDEMIADEQNKIKEIRNHRNKPKDGSEDEDLQLLG